MFMSALIFFITISAANSISWGRLVPQIVFHASAYLDLVKNRTISQGDEIDLCIPTGNFGNVLAAYYAKVCFCVANCYLWTFLF